MTKYLLGLALVTSLSTSAQRFQYEDPSEPRLTKVDVATALAEADDAEAYVGFHAGFIPAEKVLALLGISTMLEFGFTTSWKPLEQIRPILLL